MICPFCGNDNNRKNDSCNSCGRPLSRYRNRRNIFYSLTFMTLALIAVLFYMYKLPRKKPVQANKAQLEIIYRAAYHSRSGEMIVEGKIRNVSGYDLENAAVTATWYKSNGEIVNKTRANVELNPLRNLEISSFEVKVPYEEDMQNYDISFESSAGILYALELPLEQGK